MTASVDIKTPIMEIPVCDSPTAQQAATRLAKKLTSVHLTSVSHRQFCTEDVDSSVGIHGPRNLYGRGGKFCPTFKSGAEKR